LARIAAFASTVDTSPARNASSSKLDCRLSNDAAASPPPLTTNGRDVTFTFHVNSDPTMLLAWPPNASRTYVTKNTRRSSLRPTGRRNPSSEPLLCSVATSSVSTSLTTYAKRYENGKSCAAHTDTQHDIL
jgi:hypothetical protein